MLFFIKLYYLKQKWARLGRWIVVLVIAWFILLFFCIMQNVLPVKFHGPSFLCCHRSHTWFLYWLPSALCLLSLFKNYFKGVWQKFTSVMAKFGLDWVKCKPQTAVLFKTQVSISPALQAGGKVFDFCQYLCHWGIKAEPPDKKLQQLTLFATT